jgi:ribonuclease P protein component
LPAGQGLNIPGQGFAKADRIRRRADIGKVFSSGRRFSCRGLRLHVHATGSGRTRVVFVPVRSYPNAVARNKARRLVRECWRTAKADMAQGFDVAVVLYPGFDSLGERKAQLERLLRLAGLLA